jgi:PEP-CTERM motif
VCIFVLPGDGPSASVAILPHFPELQATALFLSSHSRRDVAYALFRGALGGTGTINGNVVMGGTLTPGALGAPGAITIFGNYEQTGNGTFDELMGPLSHSFLNVSGNVSLDSRAFLDITLLDGYDPLNQTFSIMDFAFLNGQIANGSSFWDDGYLWDITYRQHEVDVTAVQAPEPSSLLLLFIGLGLAVLALYAHRKMDKTQHLALT